LTGNTIVRQTVVCTPASAEAVRKKHTGSAASRHKRMPAAAGMHFDVSFLFMEMSLIFIIESNKRIY
jgi:hypothetical protein